MTEIEEMDRLRSKRMGLLAAPEAENSKRGVSTLTPKGLPGLAGGTGHFH